MDIISLLMQYVNLPAVLLAIVFTQLLRRLLPTPDGSTSKFAVGKKMNKALPWIPVIFAIGITMILEGLSSASTTKGLMSGWAAVWGYKTAKVSIFEKEEKKDGDGK